jgi:hypothetical protein
MPGNTQSYAKTRQGVKLKINVVAELVFKFFDIFGGCRGDAKVVQARLIPAAEVVAAIRLNIEIDLAIGNRPDKNINNLGAFSINDRGYRALIQHVDAATNKGVTFLNQGLTVCRSLEFTSTK